jgi:hypothetical protein
MPIATNHPPLLRVIARVLSPLAICSCSLAGSDPTNGEELLAVSRSALSQPGWHPERVRGSGGGCRFSSDDAGSADAFALASGGDMALVFTRLGEITRHGKRRSMTISRCDFAVPLTVPDGTYVSSWSQSMQYGAVKPAGVAAGLSLRSSLDASRGPSLPLPTLERRFERAESVNIALDSLASDGTTALGGNGNGRRQKWCKRGREIDHELRGVASTWAERGQDDQDAAVVLAIDGLDMRVDFAATLEACAAR